MHPEVAQTVGRIIRASSQLVHQADIDRQILADAPVITDMAEQKVSDAVSQRVALAATDLGRVTQQRVGHRESRDPAIEDGIAVHRVPRVGVEIAIMILAAEFQRVLAADHGQIPAALPDVVANHLSAAAAGRIRAKADVDQRVAEDFGLVHFHAGRSEKVGARDRLVCDATTSVGLVEPEADFKVVVGLKTWIQVAAIVHHVKLADLVKVGLACGLLKSAF